MRDLIAMTNHAFHNKGRKDRKKLHDMKLKVTEIEIRIRSPHKSSEPIVGPYAATVSQAESQLDDLQYIQSRQDPSRSWICYRDLEIWTSLQSCTRMPKRAISLDAQLKHLTAAERGKSNRNSSYIV